jgi:hypothetical protein
MQSKNQKETMEVIFPLWNRKSLEIPKDIGRPKHKILMLLKDRVI